MKLRKIGFSCLLAASLLSFTACSNDSKKENNDDLSYLNSDDEIYHEALGDFYEIYSDAKNIADDSERYVMMASAEAQMLASAVMLPLQTNGGSYAISNVAIHSVPYVKWGNDSSRFKTTLVADKNIKAIDREEMKKMWEEKRGSDDFDYLEWAKSYLNNKGYNLKRTYNTTYNSDVETWDILATSKAIDSEVLVNTHDGLLEYDSEGDLKLALAEDYSISEDGKEYTFKLRQGVKWVDVQGTELYEVKASDFVSGFQHMLDAKGGMEYLVEGVIEGASEYINGTTTFDNVGVKALDDYTIKYTLTEKKSYFLTMLGYSIFAPLCTDYYIARGGEFGSNFDSSSSTYSYGRDRSSIAYCGPYIITEATSGNKMTFKRNNKYWDLESINVDEINWLYNDGKDELKAYNDMKKGIIDGTSLNTASVAQAKKDGMFNTYSYITETATSTFSSFYNLKRQTFELSDGGAKSNKTNEQKKNTYKAMNNTHFRRAISYALDRVSYHAQMVGDDLAKNTIRNSYTPGDFVYITRDVIKDNNTFKAGTYYGEILQYYIDKLELGIKVWDSNTKLGDGFDGWYNPTNAKLELDYAIKELDIEITKDNPIILDYPYFSGSTVYTNRANVYKKTVEASLDGLVKINLIACNDASDWHYCGYLTSTGSEANYDIYDLSGWGPDYGDPSSYLDTMLPNYQGYMTKCIGLY
ncbi:MAG: hypothetical protein IJY14_00090 [Acholeplasmatales bacterium]|nr:hypothetical protein [Acholeplasmatales bacterium]